MDKNINADMAELKEDELELVTGGSKHRQDNMCACGRGKVYLDGKCKHCYLLNQNK